MAEFLRVTSRVLARAAAWQILPRVAELRITHPFSRVACGFKPAFVSGSEGDAGGDHWLLMVARGHLGGTRPGACAGGLGTDPVGVLNPNRSGHASASATLLSRPAPGSPEGLILAIAE